MVSGSMMLPLFLNPFQLLAADKLKGYKRLVVIQLSGGNDGLNTVIPYRNDDYYKLRPVLGIKAGEVLKLNEEQGLNPGMIGLRDLYDKGELAVVNNVGYPNPNRSHFRSMDIWHSASNSDEFLTTGWIGRYLDSHCENPHSVLEIDRSLSLAVKGEEHNALATPNSMQLYNTTRERYFQALVDGSTSIADSTGDLGFLYKTMADTYSSAAYIRDTAKLYKQDYTYPKGQLAGRLRQTAQFINSGMQTRVYYVSMGGFDTHANQKGKHNNLLKQYSDSVSAFVADLKQQGTFDDTLIMTFSEFGRRVKQNASNGTDHGTANNVFLIGSKLKRPGIIDSTPNLTDLDRGDLRYKVDFRRLYADVLNQWLEVDSANVLGRMHKPLGVV